MAIEKDTTTINQVAAKDSTSLNAKIDSIIIEEYTADDQGSKQITEVHKKDGHKVSPCQKRNNTSKGAKSPKKKIKVYGANISGTWLSVCDSLNKKMKHQTTTKSEIKQKTPTMDIIGSKNIYILIAFVIALFIGFVFWKNAAQ